MISKQQAYQKIQDLVTRFEEQLPSYKKADYNETLTRRDFIDPFFKALGWDIDNEQGYAEAYREVIHEDRIKIGKATKAPDYSFRLSGGKRLFFVEAKKPSVAVKEEIAPAYQVRRYGWSAKLPISIITDFEEFAVYDCTKKPNPNDKASVARIHYLTFRDYLTQFDFLWDTFSKERVLKGSFDKYIQSTANKKGTATVDREFLQSLDAWRTLLAENIAKCNKELNEDEINFVVQQTIDRIIFLRIAEDRGVEPYGTIQSVLKHNDYYQTLFSIFKQADDKYNSGLFDFKKDTLSKNLTIENKVLKTIANQLYYPESPYEFSVLSVEILGSAYEQFLGKQITLSKSGKAVIEEKPEVRKAGGVYYTPQYIVDYIVQNTVGKLCETKTPKQVAELRICDPACGSGSFLLGAYSYLLQWHKDYYTQDGKASKSKASNPLTPDGNLTTAEKKRILLNNIYGVDIDVNAVEVTKLSLLLKCMEGETSASIANQMTMFNERVLPTLESNIKSGNSLIDLDYYDTQLDFGDEKKIKPFSWHKAFDNVFKKNGFDAVIGNPPYIQSREEQFNEHEKDYYNNKFSTTEYQINTFGLFIEKGITLLKPNGLLGFIIPNYWLSTKYDKKLRKFVFQQNKLLELVNVYKVFESAVVDTLLLVIQQGINKRENSLLKSIDRNLKSIEERLNAIKENRWSYQKELVVDETQDDIEITFKDNIQLRASKKIGDYFDLKFGVKLYEVGKGTPPQKKEDSKNGIYESKTPLDSTYLRLLKGRHIKRYFIDWKDSYVKYGNNLAAPRNSNLFKGDRILIQRIVSKDCLDATFTDEHLICNTDVITLKPKSTLNIKFYLSLLNSKLIGRFVKNANINLDRNVFPKINTNTLENLPVPNIDEVESKMKIEVINLAEQISQLSIDFKVATLETKKEQIQNRISYCEDKINSIVYELYGVTEEEIKIVENK